MLLFHPPWRRARHEKLLFSESEDVTDEDHIFWDDLFAALALPAGVRPALLPDPDTPTCGRAVRPPAPRGVTMIPGSPCTHLHAMDS